MFYVLRDAIARWFTWKRRPAMGVLVLHPARRYDIVMREQAERLRT
jgi:hypothetical protein